MTNSQPYSVDLETVQTYNNEGQMLTVKYPDAWLPNGSGGYTSKTEATYTYTYDSLGRPNKLPDNQSIGRRTSTTGSRASSSRSSIGIRRRRRT